MSHNINAEDIQIAVIGLGYVGRPLYDLLSKHFKCIGLDNDVARIDLIKKSYSTASLNLLTSNYIDLSNCNVFIICVPTGINNDKSPDLSPLTNVCKSLGEIINRGCTVIFESTVFPGATEDFCIPLLEQYSGMKINEGFSVGYSPERINVGDNNHTINTIPKIISASNEKALTIMDAIYSSIISAPIIKASSIKVAEAAKMYENVQRDVLIALANEYSAFCKAEGISIEEVTQCASSKWNFAKVYPGLVGGHCIGIDTYYLLNRAEKKKGSLPLINCARSINETKVETVAKKIKTIASEIGAKNILLLGASYKANVSDHRNSKAIEILIKLKDYFKVDCFDTHVDKDSVKVEYNQIILTHIKELKESYDLVIKLVSHKSFENMIFSNARFIDIQDLL